MTGSGKDRSWWPGWPMLAYVLGWSVTLAVTIAASAFVLAVGDPEVSLALGWGASAGMMISLSVALGGWELKRLRERLEELEGGAE